MTMQGSDPNDFPRSHGDAQPFRRASPSGPESSPPGDEARGHADPKVQPGDAWQHLAPIGIETLDVSPLQLNTEAGRERVWQAVARYEQRVGPLLGIAGSSRHGKTELAIRWDFARRRISGNIDYVRDKTAPDQVILRPILNEHLHEPGSGTALKMFGVLDLSGERLDQMVDVRQAQTRSPHEAYAQVTLDYIEHFLWPFGQRIEGLILAVCFPILWYEVNKDRLSSVHAPTDGLAMEPIQASRTTESMLRRILHTVYRARAARRFQIAIPDSDISTLERSRSWPKLNIPVFVALTKADLLENLRSPLGKEDLLWRNPARLLRDHMPDLYQDLHQITRDFTVQYVHTFEYKVAHRAASGTAPSSAMSAAPDPFQDSVNYVDHTWMVGHQVLDEFFARHPWQRWGVRSRRWLPAPVRVS